MQLQIVYRYNYMVSLYWIGLPSASIIIII